MLIPPLFTAPAGLEIGQHLTSTTVRCLHQPDPPFSSVTHVMCFGFRAPVYGRQLIWTAVMEDRKPDPLRNDPVLSIVGIGRRLWEHEPGDRFLKRLRSEGAVSKDTSTSGRAN